MSQEHEVNISSIARSRSATEPGSTNERNTSSPEDKNSPPKKGSRAEYIETCLPLFEASISGDWEAAKAILDERPELVRFAITGNYDTPLHIAASAEINKMSEDFLKNLVNRMENDDLELLNKDCGNALMVAAANRSNKMAQILINRHKALLTMFDDIHDSPLNVSAVFGNHDMTRYLYDVSERMASEHWTRELLGLVLGHCVKGDIFEIALKILTDYPEFATDPSYCRLIFDSLAGKPDAMNTTDSNLIWKIMDAIFSKLHMKKWFSDKDQHALDLLKSVLKITTRIAHLDIYDLLKGPRDDGGNYIHPSGVIFVAAEMGNTRFVTELIRVYPQLLLMHNHDGHTIFHIAIMHRHEGIYNLLYEVGSRKFVVTTHKDKRNNTILHLVGMTSKKAQLQTMSGASLLMQRDLLWFQEVEKMLPRTIREDKNKDGQTAYQIFVENNKDLVSSGLKWTKDCMVAATLIVTVAFAVAYTVPGGYNQDQGLPIFIHERSFLVFIIADAISLFSSSTSLLVFLSILTSRYGQRDFLYSLPRKLMIGLVTLFISVATMMVTFATSFFVLYRNQLKWVPILIGIFSAMPVIVFAILQFPLWLDMFRSMYDSRYLFNPRRRTLYSKNTRL